MLRVVVYEVFLLLISGKFWSWTLDDDCQASVLAWPDLVFSNNTAMGKSEILKELFNNTHDS